MILTANAASTIALLVSLGFCNEVNVGKKADGTPATIVVCPSPDTAKPLAQHDKGAAPR